MGSNAVILVLGLVLIFGLIAGTLNNSSDKTVTTIVGYYKYSQARNIAHSAISLALRKIDDTNESNFFLSGNVDGGSYYLSCKDTIGGTYLKIKSNAIYNDSGYNIDVLFERFAKDFPVPGAAVGFDFSPVDFNIKNVTNNKVKISGIDHNYYWVNPTKLGVYDAPGDSNDVSAISVVAQSDSSNIGSKYGAVLYPDTNKISVTDTIPNYGGIVKEFIAMADVKYVATPPQLNISSISPPAWGDSIQPKIIYIDATQAPVKITGNVIGYGILVVKGKLEVSGTLNFIGLVIPFNREFSDSTVFDTPDSSTFSSTGTINIVGSVLMDGSPGSDFILNGTANIYYSSDALKDAQQIGKLQYYKIVSWYE